MNMIELYLSRIDKWLGTITACLALMTVLLFFVFLILLWMV